MANDSRVFMYVTGIATKLPTMGLRIASFSFFCLLTILMQSGLGFQFLDRYFHLCRSFFSTFINCFQVLNRSFKHWPKRMAIIGFLQLFFVIQSIVFSITNYPTKDYEVYEIESVLGSELQHACLKVAAEMNLVIMPYSIVLHQIIQKNLLTDIVLLICAFSLLFVYVLIVFCYLRIRAHVKMNLVGTGTTTTTTTNSSQNTIRQISTNMIFQVKRFICFLRNRMYFYWAFRHFCRCMPWECTQLVLASFWLIAIQIATASLDCWHMCLCPSIGWHF